jgi:alpha-amylase
VINLFMDYETFGEHQWESTGIFAFLEHLPAAVLEHPDFSFRTPSEVVKEIRPVADISVPRLTSWADSERDLSAWLGNPMQDAAAAAVFGLEREVLGCGDRELAHAWRKLTTSDHFYYMCTKYFQDGDVHKYFSPYDSPYDAFILYANAVSDLKHQVKAARRVKSARRRLQLVVPGMNHGGSLAGNESREAAVSLSSTSRARSIAPATARRSRRIARGELT